jgi:hypothetical protein
MKREPAPEKNVIWHAICGSAAIVLKKQNKQIELQGQRL